MGRIKYQEASGAGSEAGMSAGWAAAIEGRPGQALLYVKEARAVRDVAAIQERLMG